MSAAGNDFIIIEPAGKRDNQRLAQRMCHRTSGIGADGLILLEKSSRADFRMRIFNADGSEAEMCGNGVRCLATYIRIFKKINKKSLSIATQAGLVLTKVAETTARVRLTDPKDFKAHIPVTISHRTLHVHYIDTGVPHTVIFVDNLKDLDVKTIGRQIRFHKKFAPRGTNVNFVEQQGPGRIAIRTYERGVEDETLACGTGSAAAALITFAQANPSVHDRNNIPVAVQTAGEHLLNIHFDLSQGIFKNVWLEGPTLIIAKGLFFV